MATQTPPRPAIPAAPPVPVRRQAQPVPGRAVRREGTSPRRLLFPPHVVGFTVEPGGAILTMPTRFRVRSHEIVAWLIGNRSKEPVTVSLESFLLDGELIPQPSPLIWLVEPSVHLDINETRQIAALRNPEYRLKHLFRDRVKYTIHVQGDTSRFDESYDPDGDIKP